ncbi:uncharacterized protein GGS22DRAFT_172676 [Annulohypoxylon maeteangense]|uniref:uncharacterized protein n=1 Tax=Annulohypoxylon maeteangense TaxID=1927788 RepID=UPI0020072862|nr:uncharacterized protein GGS22DRAFT_172676 [Annulohypoxylon maeteangense]KAI0881214.1 hypothetical protein GGS22DRAFT_172676 [Annulohypoxylon maeteangense]
MSANTSGSYLARLENFHQLDKEREDMLKELITKYQELEQRFEAKCKDHDNEAQTRSLYQAQANEAHKKYTEIQHKTEINSFVFAIIDGDGACFREDWILKGAEGGAIAAEQLRLDIKHHLKNIYPDVNVDLWNVIVQITLNLEGLSRKLDKIGFVRTLNDLPNFTRGFSRAQGLFSIIDVGWGKEQADFKVRETLRLMIHNLQCKHIIFGPCHDRGYIVELRPYKLDASISNKLSLLETTIAPRDFQELQLRRVRFPDVFRSEPLPDSPLSPPPPPPSQSPPPPPPPSSIPLLPVSPPRQITPIINSSIDSDPSVTARVPSRIPSSWGTPNPTPTIKESRKFMSSPDASPKSTASPFKYCLINSSGQRIDEEIPAYDFDAEYRLKMRSEREEMMLKKKGPCNRWHLNGKCELTICPYYHGERLSSGEQLLLKGKARNMVCVKKSACRDVDCFWGHHCKYESSGKKCPHSNCYFASTHSMDMTPTERIYADGSHERLPKRQSF